ncbi:MAG: LapA family protein [Burkholderiaceae bacterium]
MKRLNTLLSLGTLLLLTAAAALAFLNWPALSAPATWQLGFAEVQAPVGAAFLLLAGVLFVPLVVAYLGHVIGTMIETRRTLLEVQRLQKLADQAEASRIDGLRDLIGQEFSRLHARLDALPTGEPGMGSARPPGLAVLSEVATSEAPVAAAPAKALSRWFRAA